MAVTAYPEKGRTAWILERRPARLALPDPREPRGVFLEKERLADGLVATSGVILLTNRECPWKCLMCDLWKETTVESVPRGAIPGQIRSALARWSEPPVQLKVYNSGSFFDAAAIPPEDYPEIADQIRSFRNVVVESHPKLVGGRALALRDRLDGTLEVAMGLETAHPDALRRLNKGFGLDDFARAASFLRREGMALRAFLLVHPPFVDPAEAAAWSVRSAEFAFDCGAGAVSFIPTRSGNGAIDVLIAGGEFHLPTLADLERAQAGGLALGRGRVFADTWAAAAFATCPRCVGARLERLERINRTQIAEAPAACPHCDGA